MLQYLCSVSDLRWKLACTFCAKQHPQHDAQPQSDAWEAFVAATEPLPACGILQHT